MVTLTKEQDYLLGELAQLQGRTKSSYLRELVDGAESTWRAILPVMKLHAAAVGGQAFTMREVVLKVLSGAYGFGDETRPVLSALMGNAFRIDEVPRDELVNAARGAGGTAASSEDRTAPPPPDPVKGD